MHSGSTKMRKKIVTTLLITTIAHAEIEQSGFFVGVDISSKTSNVNYETNQVNWSGIADISKYKTTPFSYKLGYQYYFTRVYARMSKDTYVDTQKNRYEIKSTHYEFNIEYIPTFYISNSKNFILRGIMGVGVGYGTNTLSNTLSSAEAVKPALESNPKQKYMEYGAQVGFMLESSYGVSLETGIRYREASMIEVVVEDTNVATFNLDFTSFYFGLNYLF